MPVGTLELLVLPGAELARLPLPTDHITNVAFGGPDLRTAWVTLAGTGKLVKLRWPRPGLPLNFLNAGAAVPPAI